MSLVPLAAVDLSQVDGPFAAQQIWAGALIVGFLLLIFIGLRIIRLTRQGPKDGDADGGPSVDWTQFGSLVGLDDRVSTSRTIAFLWTAVVGYCLLALALIAALPTTTAMPVPPGSIPVGFISEALAPLAPGYLVLLGAPYLAVIGAQVAVSQGLTTGKVQKARSSQGPSPLDVVSDDDGNVDLLDLQYTLFNLIAATYVLTQFIPHPGEGVPVIPAALATLTGVSAAAYTTKKAAASNRATITDVLTPTVTAGQSASVAGDNLVVSPDLQDPKTDLRRTRVFLTLTDPDPASVGDPKMLTATAVQPTAATPTSITFDTPKDLQPGVWTVRVRTNGGGSVTSRKTLTVRGPAPAAGRAAKAVVGDIEPVRAIGTP